MMEKPLYERLEEWSKTQPISMHVPGHKNQTIGDLSFLTGRYDITEISGFDDLHHPEGLLKQSMANVNRHPDYDAFFLVNGTTSGILATIHAFQEQSGQVVMARNVHKSVFNALDLGAQQAVILPTEVDRRTAQYSAPNLRHLDLENGKLGVVTYPNYYGQTFNIDETIKQFHQHNIPVLVDEAHGAHFDLEGFPQSALNCNADFVVQSFHKTLPSLTMSSVLFIHKAAPQREKVIALLGTFQSSSPSYLLMASLEAANAFYQSYESTHFFEQRAQVLATLRQSKLHVLEVDDPLKVLIAHPNLAGYELQKRMEELGIYVELADESYVLWILPLWHESDVFPFELLLQRIAQIEVPQEERETEAVVSPKLYTGGGNYIPSSFEKDIWLPYHKAENRILAQHLILYPPGVPSLLKGEQVSLSMIELIDYWCQKGFRIEGLSEGKIKVKDD